MAGAKVNNYSNIDTNIQALQLTTDKVFKGLHQLTLTEMDTTTVPAIAAGSVVECNGALIKYDSEEAIVTTDPHTSATVADGAVYVVIKGADYTVYFTATAPTWSDSKQGYYGLTTWANDRYVGWTYKATASYTGKTSDIFDKKNIIKSRVSTYNISNISHPPSSGTPILNGVYYDDNGDYDTGSYTFTAPRTGSYLVSGYIGTFVSSATSFFLVFFEINGVDVSNAVLCSVYYNAYAHMSPSKVLKLNAGDTLKVRTSCGTSGGATTGASGFVVQYTEL